MSTATTPTPYVLVQLQSGEPEYDIISREFVKDNIKVTKIERLENTRLSDRFQSEQDEMTNHTPGQYNNVQLFSYFYLNIMYVIFFCDY